MYSEIRTYVWGSDDMDEYLVIQQSFNRKERGVNIRLSNRASNNTSQPLYLFPFLVVSFASFLSLNPVIGYCTKRYTCTAGSFEKENKTRAKKKKKEIIIKKFYAVAVRCSWVC